MLKVCRYTLPVDTKSYPADIVCRDWNKSFTHIAVAPKRLAVRVWCSVLANTQSLLAMSFRLGGFQTSFLLINVRYGPNTFTKMWRRTYPICEASISRSAPLSLKPLQKSRRNHRSYVWTEAISGYGFIADARAIRYSGTQSREACTPLPVCSLPQRRCLWYEQASTMRSCKNT